jgi:peptidoglycan/LPS O-acetylase OafA/YrhL
MNPAAVFLVICSLTNLILGLLAWRLTNSKPTLLNLLLCSAFLLFAGYFIAGGKDHGDMTWLPSFLATMLCGGRAIGFMLRYKREPEIRVPALLVLAAALTAVAGTLTAFRTVH